MFYLYIWKMENTKQPTGQIYSVNFTEKQAAWIADKNQQLISLMDLHKRRLIKEIDVQHFCEQTTAILTMILREGEWRK